MMIGIFTRRRLEQLGGEPKYTLCLVGGHELRHHRLQISKHLDLRERLFFDWIHSRPRTGLRRAESEIYAKALPRAAGRSGKTCPRKAKRPVFGPRAESHKCEQTRNPHWGRVLRGRRARPEIAA